MVVYYDLLGQKVGSHWLAIGVLTTTFTGIYAMSGGTKKTQGRVGPPINASSKDEENFIQEFLKNADGEKKASGKH